MSATGAGPAPRRAARGAHTRIAAAWLLAAASFVLLVKALSILATGSFVFEDPAIVIGILLAGAGVAALALDVPRSRLRFATVGAGAVSALLGAANLAAANVPENVRAPLYVGSTLGLIASLLLAGFAGRGTARWAPLSRWTGILVVPLMLAGAALSLVNERLLELGIVALALLLGALALAAKQDRTPA